MNAIAIIATRIVIDRARQQFHIALNAALAPARQASNPEVDLALANGDDPETAAAKIIATRAELATKEWPPEDYPFAEWELNPEVTCQWKREDEAAFQDWWRGDTLARARGRLEISRWLGVD